MESTTATAQPLLLPSPVIATQKHNQGVLVFDRSHRVVHASSTLPALLQLSSEASLLGEAVEEVLRLAFGQKQATASAITQWLDQPATPSHGLIEAPLVLQTAADARIIHATLCSISEQLRIATFDDVSPVEIHSNAPVLAYRDPLTGIGNRSLMERKLDEALFGIGPGEVERVVVLFLDLDRFKAINDTLGHAIGDELLRLVCGRLQSALRVSDTLARMGGDEFAILLTAPSNRNVASALATRIIDLIQRTYLIDGQIMNVGASIGIAVAPRDGLTRGDLLKSADLALYYSKTAGRGVFHFFEPAMAEKARERQKSEFDLRKALVLRQFELRYQAKIDAETGSILGLVALLRWHHPQRGLLPPVEFMPLAEEIGLAVSIGEWVLNRVCRDATSWPESITAAVSVSPLQFASDKLASSVEHALQAAELPGKRLEIGVTEEILLRNNSSVLKTLTALKALGVKVVMDSFGIGLASLSQVVNFPFDKINIDHSLLEATHNDAKSRAILRAIAALGESLGIVTLAEGVETSEQLTRVRSDGGSSVQGFYCSKALPAGELAALFVPLIQRVSPSGSDRSNHEQ
jgi:diguanylate cyclase (GGDEF)-like protein